MMVYIEDMLESIDLIEKYIGALAYERFEKNYETQDAVIRRLGIIGEAASRLTDEFKKKYPGIPWKQIVGLRNVIIHDYSTLNLKTIWEIITKDLKDTKKKILEIRS